MLSTVYELHPVEVKGAKSMEGIRYKEVMFI